MLTIHRAMLRWMLMLGTTLVWSMGALTADAAPHAGPVRGKDKAKDAKTRSDEEGVLWLEPEERFSLLFPEDWTRISPPPTGTVVAFRSDPEDASDGFAENVNVVLETIPAGYSQKEYLVAAVDSLETVTNYEEHATGRWIRDGQPGLWLEYSADFIEGIHSHNLVFVTTEPGRGIIITCSSVDGSFEDWEDRLRAIAETFEFE